MKRKIVVEVHMKCGKCRTKAMKIAAIESGVTSVQISGESKDQVVVIGEEVDSVCLTRSLRKKFGSARLVSVEEVKNEENNVHSITSYYHDMTNYPQPLVYYQNMVHDANSHFCCIM